MNGKIVAGFCIGGIVVGALWYIQMGQWNASAPVEPKFRQLIFVGDTADRVDELLGTPSIEFPKAGSVVRWYAGYEISLSNRVVTAVKLRPIESEQEQQEKELRAKMAEERLQAAYGAVALKEKISYDAWLERERKRLQAEREKRAAVQAYEKRKSQEKKASIYAEAIRKSCGCYHDHYCYRCR